MQVSKFTSIILLFISLAAGCSIDLYRPNSPQFFQRYTPADHQAFNRDLEETRRELEGLRREHKHFDALRIAADLGGMLTSARREEEALALLEPTLRDARRLAAQETIGWTLLYLATANQYLDKRSDAKLQFDEALDIAKAIECKELEHYVLHHRGRLKVESNDLAGARSDFQSALLIRRELSDGARVASTLTALKALRAGEVGQQP